MARLLASSGHVTPLSVCPVGRSEAFAPAQAEAQVAARPQLAASLLFPDRSDLRISHRAYRSTCFGLGARMHVALSILLCSHSSDRSPHAVDMSCHVSVLCMCALRVSRSFFVTYACGVERDHHANLNVAPKGHPHLSSDSARGILRTTRHGRRRLTGRPRGGL